MDSSFGKNGFNRIEESYGDTKNLSGRHPAGRDRVSIRHPLTGFDDERASVLRLIDLLEKLAKEPEDYDTTRLIVIDYSDAPDDNGARIAGLEMAPPTRLEPVPAG
jgi:hypothetical protein